MEGANPGGLNGASFMVYGWERGDGMTETVMTAGHRPAFLWRCCSQTLTREVAENPYDGPARKWTVLPIS